MRLQLWIGFEGKDAPTTDDAGALEGNEANTGSQLDHHVIGLQIGADGLEFASFVVAAADVVDDLRSHVIADLELYAFVLHNHGSSHAWSWSRESKIRYFAIGLGSKSFCPWLKVCMGGSRCHLSERRQRRPRDFILDFPDETPPPTVAGSFADRTEA